MFYFINVFSIGDLNVIKYYFLYIHIKLNV